ILTKHAGLPAPELGHLRQLLARRRILSRHGLEPVAGAKHAGIQIEPRRGRVAHRLQRVDARVELGIAVPARRLGKAGQIRLRHSLAAAHRIEQLAAARLQQSTRHALYRCENFAGRRLLARYFEQLLVADHAKGGPVELTRDGVAPGDELAENGELAAREIARAFDSKKGVGRIVVGPACAFEQREFLTCPPEPSGAIEIGLQAVAQLEQMDRVLRGVVEHPLAERAHRPVGALVLFVELDPEVAFEERSEAERAEPEQLRSNARVEDVPHVPAVILLEEPQVVVGVVEHDLDVRALEERAEEGRRADGQRIDDRRLVARRELKQVDSIDEAMEAGALGVEGERARLGDGLEEAVDGARGVEVERRMHAGNLTGIPLARSRTVTTPSEAEELESSRARPSAAAWVAQLGRPAYCRAGDGDVRRRPTLLVRQPALPHGLPRHSVRARRVVWRRCAAALALASRIERGADRDRVLRDPVWL